MRFAKLTNFNTLPWSEISTGSNVYSYFQKKMFSSSAEQLPFCLVYGYSCLLFKSVDFSQYFCDRLILFFCLPAQIESLPYADCILYKRVRSFERGILGMTLTCI